MGVERLRANRKLTQPRVTLAIVGVVVAVLVVTGSPVGLSLGSGHSMAVIARPTPPGAPSTASGAHSNAAGSLRVERTYRGLSEVYMLASAGKYALLALNYPSGLTSLVLVNAATNSSKFVERKDPGGIDTYPASLIGAGGAFFMEWLNGSTFQVNWQEISTNGSVRNVTLPITRNAEWTFAYGNQSALFVTTGPILLELDPTTLTIAANYSREVPRAVVNIEDVLPVGNRLYLTGVALNRTTDVDRGFFGFLNLSTRVATTVARVGGTSNSAYSTEFYVMVAGGSDIYVGGAVTFDNGTVYEVAAGLLYRYNPATSHFQNMSRLLPTADWGVFALEPWGSTVAVSMNWFSIVLATGRTTQVGGVYTLAHSPSLHLVNATADFPGGYVPNTSYVTAESSGWYFSGGGNSVSGLAQFAAVKP
jgi:hypothetical protein